DAARVEERHEVGAYGEVAAVLRATRVDGVVKDDHLPGGRGGCEVVIEEGVLRAAGLRARVAVEHHEVCVPLVERVVVLAAGGVVRGGVGRLRSACAARWRDVRIA